MEAAPPIIPSVTEAAAEEITEEVEEAESETEPVEEEQIIQEEPAAEEEIMVETTDGFIIAEEDLKLRGPGDLEGTAQSGLPIKLCVANITKDASLMEQTRNAARSLLTIDPTLSAPEHQQLLHHLSMLKGMSENYSEIS